GDDAGTGAGGLEQHHARRGLTLHGVRDRAADARDAEEMLLGRLDALGDGRGHLLGLPVPDTDHAVAVADHHQGREAEPAATLDHLGHPVDGHYSLEVCGALVCPATAVVTALPPLPAATPSGSCHYKFLPVLQVMRKSWLPVTATARLRGHRRRARPPGRGRRSHPGRRRRRGYPPPWRGWPAAGPPDAPGPSCRPPRRARPLPG